MPQVGNSQPHPVGNTPSIWTFPSSRLKPTPSCHFFTRPVSHFLSKIVLFQVTCSNYRRPVNIDGFLLHFDPSCCILIRPVGSGGAFLKLKVSRQKTCGGILSIACTLQPFDSERGVATISAGGEINQTTGFFCIEQDDPDQRPCFSC